jgi:SAM domain (Sterile alpha motif)
MVVVMVRGWLASGNFDGSSRMAARVGLEKYMHAFRANDIDGEVLRRLTGEDLRELGVNSIGHRRRRPDGIAALSTAEAPPAPTRSPSPPAKLGAAS